MSKYNLLDIHEGMGYKEYEDAKEADRLEAHPEKDTIKKIKAMMAKEKSVKEGEAVDLAIEASQEKAGIKEDEEYSNHRDRLRKTMRLVFDIVRKYDLDAEDVMDELGEEFNVPFEFGRAGGIEENIIKEEEGFVEVSKDEIKMHLDQYRDGNIDGDDLANAVEEIVFSRMDESFDSLAKKLDKQKGITKKEAGKIAGSIAAKKMKGAGKGPTAKQKKRMNEGEVPMELLKAIQKYANEDNGMGFQDALKNIKTALYKVNRETRGFSDMEQEEIPMFKGTRDALDDISIREDDGKKKMDEGVVKSVMQALRDDAKATNDEIKAYMTSLMKAGDEFDEIDDYVEDFKNYIADKSLQEHFSRFM